MIINSNIIENLIIIKITGVICILAGCILCGIKIARSMKLRLIELREIENILLFLSGEIEYNLSPLSLAFRNISVKVRKPFSNWLLLLSEDLARQDGDSFSEIWEDRLDYLYNKLFLKKDDMMVLHNLGRSLGYLDVKQQLAGIILSKREMEILVKQVEGEIAGKLKTAITFGALAGIFLVLVLV